LSPELLAPAGDRECAFAALEYGADALYLGLRRFSARADAVNFSPEEAGEVIDYAHRMTPARRVYVTFNTVLQNREWPEALAALAEVDELGADAVIVQDFGVARVVRREFPRLRLHASTQMALHEPASIAALADLGFSRVTLARELTLAEIRVIRQAVPLEIEVFAHGALCYAYSGLCLYSSLLRGRSGNRGRCAYPCRGAIRWGESRRFSFSMKDLALEEQVRDLAAAGVHSLKIEGRKKSPLYVAAVTALYRRILDGAPRSEIEARAGDTRAIFSRSRTRLCLDGRHAPEVTDPDLVGHRGKPIGRVNAVRNREDGGDELIFQTREGLERHDGLQLDLPVEHGKPFGFAVDRLGRGARAGGPFRDSVNAAAGDWVAVRLPAGHPPLAPGLEIHLAASQAVRRKYPVTTPRPGEFRVRRPITLRIDLQADRIRFAVEGVESSASEKSVAGVWEFPGPFDVCRTPADQTPIFQKAFERVGDFPYTVSELTLLNPAGLFCPVSRVNEWRRQVLAGYREREAERARGRLAERVRAVSIVPAAAGAVTVGALPIKWSVRIDRLDSLEGFDIGDWAAVDEVILEVTSTVAADAAGAAAFVRRVAPVRVRLALPLIWRGMEPTEWADRIRRLAVETGVSDWQAGHWGAARWLAEAGCACRSLTADWNLYALNRQAVIALREGGFSAVTASPEDDADNWIALAGEFPEILHLPVYHTIPLFISEHCAHPCAPARSCAACARESAAVNAMPGGGEERLQIVHRDGLTLTLNRRAFAAPPAVRDRLVAAGARRFRAEFCRRAYTPDEVCALWRLLLKGDAIPDTEAGNLLRGLK